MTEMFQRGIHGFAAVNFEGTAENRNTRYWVEYYKKKLIYILISSGKKCRGTRKYLF